MDFSALSYIDPSGVAMLKGLIEAFQKLDIPVYISGCSGIDKVIILRFFCYNLEFLDRVYEMLRKCSLINTKTSTIRVFSTVHDAVLCVSEIIAIPAYTISTISRL